MPNDEHIFTPQCRKLEHNHNLSNFQYGVSIVSQFPLEWQIKGFFVTEIQEMS